MLGQATGNLDSLDSPRPGLGGSHHLPPYSILCSSARGLHPNGSFSQDSQSGVPKLSQFGLPRLWAFITSRPELGSGRGLNQSCSSRRELFNAMSHYCCRRWEEVDFRLLVVGSQTANLTPGPSFAHNLGCKCPHGSCEAILDIYTSRTFQWHKEHSNARRFDPWSSEFSGVPGDSNFPLLGVWASPSHLSQSGVATQWLRTCYLSIEVKGSSFHMCTLKMEVKHYEKKKLFYTSLVTQFLSCMTLATHIFICCEC